MCDQPSDALCTATLLGRHRLTAVKSNGVGFGEKMILGARSCAGS
jgi:hypothetical protein